MSVLPNTTIEIPCELSKMLKDYRANGIISQKDIDKAFGIIRK